jgi:hypothetical protein
MKLKSRTQMKQKKRMDTDQVRDPCLSVQVCGIWVLRYCIVRVVRGGWGVRPPTTDHRLPNTDRRLPIVLT